MVLAGLLGLCLASSLPASSRPRGSQLAGTHACMHTPRKVGLIGQVSHWKPSIGRVHPTYLESQCSPSTYYATTNTGRWRPPSLLCGVERGSGSSLPGLLARRGGALWGQKTGPAKALAKVSKVEQPPVAKRSRGFVTRKEAPKFFALRCVSDKVLGFGGWGYCCRLTDWSLTQTYKHTYTPAHAHSLMMFCIIYVFTMTRDTKDTLIVSYCGACGPLARPLITDGPARGPRHVTPPPSPTPPQQNRTNKQERRPSPSSRCTAWCRRPWPSWSGTRGRRTTSPSARSST